MSVDEVVELASRRHRLLIHNRGVFFNTHDAQEASWWDGQGAYVRPWYDERERFFQKRTNRELPQGYEVMLNHACEKVFMEADDGELLNITDELLVNRVRQLRAA